MKWYTYILSSYWTTSGRKDKGEIRLLRYSETQTQTNFLFLFSSPLSAHHINKRLRKNNILHIFAPFNLSPCMHKARAQMLRAEEFMQIFAPKFLSCFTRDFANKLTLFSRHYAPLLGRRRGLVKKMGQNYLLLLKFNWCGCSSEWGDFKFM